MATIFSPGWTFSIAIGVLFVSLAPLFATKEPVKIGQRVDMSVVNPLHHIRDYASMGMMNLAHLISSGLWPLLLAVFIFDSDVYAKVGVLVALTTLVSVFSAYMFGKFIDSKRGLYLLRYGTVMYGLGDVLRSIITTSSGALALGMVSEPSFLSVKLPLQKSFYDRADTIGEDKRIAYIAWAEIAGAIMKFTFTSGLFIATFFFDPVSVLRVGFVVGGVLAPVMLLQRFPTLKRV